MRGIIICVSMLAACGGGQKHDGPGMLAPKAELCIDPVAPGGTSLSLTREDQPGLVADGDDKGVGKLLEPGRAVWAVVEVEPGVVAVAITAGENCGMQPCNPQIVRVADGAVASRTPLPHGDDIATSGDYPFVVDWLSIEDGDGDGTPEVWTSYNIISPPEPGVGSTTSEHVAVFSLPDLALRFEANYADYPEAASLERCDGALSLVDADCDGDRDLVLDKSCAFAFCFEIYDGGSSVDGDAQGDLCGTGPKVTGTVYYQQADGSFLKA